ncbi:DUF1449 family protein [Alteromonas aestuariivivens]|uniref:DUF1449 family protein n=1 Tax=Alteromonas aestuariivivens TaxID=1938339 RepID=A0A3D8M4Z4_9ALTE|nr:OB-fold-containig protein [Alteromonas aestuariivivens]RDV24615.1 DUF1449 family protein [Alteromonas aestuariivivens]
MSFLFSDANMFYSAALVFVVLLFMVEVLGLLFGLSLVGLLDDIVSVDAKADLSATGPSELLSWLCLDRLPLLVWLILWLTCFGATGFFITSFLLAGLPFGVPAALHIVVSMIFATFLTAKFGGGLAKLIPKQQSTAIDTESLVGSAAVITLGTACAGSPAEAKVTDAFQQLHYVMVEPMENDNFVKGDTVILVQKGPRGWLATRYQ